MRELKNHSMDNTGFNRVKSAFQHLQTEYLPKGELWLGADILKKAGLEDNLEGRLHLVKRLKHDMICLSTAREPYMNEALGYRYFPVSTIQEVLDTTDLFVMAVIDGPFQQLVGKMGLMKVLTGRVSERETFLKAYENERADVENLLDRCLEQPVHGVVIADDLAGDQGTFFHPLSTIEPFQKFMRRTLLPCFIPAATFLKSCHNFSPTGLTAWRRFRIEPTILCR
jgi:hypothetical protein